MDERAIPPLPIDYLQKYPTLHLLQSHVLLRHGARTPDHPSVCWTGYDEFWDCEITTLMAPHDLMDDDIRQGLGGMVSKAPGEGGGQFLFEKIYDALQPPLYNTLGGTCLTGQLIKRGYLQEFSNGRHLRDAYIKGEAYQRLFANASYETGRPYGESTRFRGDDQQRILLSGQTVIRGLFDVAVDTVVPFHTAELKLDPIYTNKRICPRLREIERSVINSRVFQERNSSEEVRELSVLLDSTNSNWDHIMDCLMTQKCNGRPVHPTYDDFTSDDDDSVFSRIVRHHTFQKIHHYRADHAKYAKLAMGPLWAEIVSTLSVTLDRDVQTLSDMKRRNVPLLLLYSGHDSTLMPFLSTLGDDVWDGTWTPYGSTVIIESYALGANDYKFPSGKAFRIVFNGKPLTPKICGAELCDLHKLLRQVRPFATWHRQCETSASKGGDIEEVKEKYSDEDDEEVIELIEEDERHKLTTAGLIGVVIGSCLGASFITFELLTNTKYGRAWFSKSNLGYEMIKGRDMGSRTGSYASFGGLAPPNRS